MLKMEKKSRTAGFSVILVQITDMSLIKPMSAEDIERVGEMWRDGEIRRDVVRDGEKKLRNSGEKGRLC